MATDIERLSILIEANTKSYERSMLKLQQQTDKAIRGASTSIRNLDGALVRATSTAKTFAIAFGAGFLAGGLATLPGMVRGVVKELADLGDTADKIGITSDRLQELNYQAGQTGSSSETMASALEQFAKRVGEAAQKGGDLAKIFAANGIALKDAEGNLRPLNDLLSDYANLLRGAKSTSDQFVLSTEAFGRGAGADMVLVLRDGADGLRRFADEAQSTGQIIRQNLVKDAQEIDDKFDSLAGTLSTFAKSQVLIFVRDLAQAFEDLRGVLDAVRAAAGEGISFSVDAADDVDGLKEKLDDTNVSIVELTAAIAGFGNGAPAYMIAQLAELEARAKSLQAQLGSTSASLTGGYDPLSSVTAPLKPTVLPPPPPKKDSGASAIEREKKAVIELIAELQRERALIGATEIERRISNELRRAGTAATETQRQAITALVTEIEAAAEAELQLIEALDGIRDAAGGALNAFVQSIANGEGAAAGLKAALADILQTVIRIGQEQAIASLFGGLGTSGGGLLGGVIGKLFAPRMAGQIVPSGAGGGGAQRVEVAVTVAPSPLLITTTQAAIGASERKMMKAVPGAVADHQRRYG